MTPELAAKAKALVELGYHQHQAAALLGINQGRVSEVMTGKRFKLIRPFRPDQLEFDV